MTALNKDFLAGAMFAALGFVAIKLSFGYKIGTAGHMGPGYVPLLLGSGMAIFGAIIGARGVVAAILQAKESTADFNPWNPRPLLSVLMGIVLYGLLIMPAGLIVASFALLACGGQAIKGQRLAETLVLASVLIAIVTLVFVCGIGVRIDLLPSLPVLLWS